MRILAIALLVLGTVALIYGGIGYNRERTVIDFGGIKATATEHKSLPLPPVAGAIALIAGVALLVVGKRRA
ncbi:MAG: DUF3185 domain-containing protein [Candidatus Krumholzibacteriia bacterium]